MLKAVIVDDQEISRAYLFNALKEHCRKEVEISAMAGNVRDAIKIIKQHAPDIVFLDVELMEGTGFEVLESVEKEDFEVIFTTGYEQYAIQAIKASALDYLQKPVDPEELKGAIIKAGQVREEKKLKQDLIKRSEEDTANKIAIPVSGGVEYISAHEIVRCESDHYYTKIFMENGKKLLVSKTLKDFEEMLTEFGFARVHQSHLINLKHLRKFDKIANKATLSNTHEIPVSRRKREALAGKVDL